MRARILDAVVSLLVETGYARTSTWAVCKRAQVSRGALLHHFPTRISLFVGAASHLAEAPLEVLDAKLAMTPAQQQPRVFLDWLWSTLDGDLFPVGLELLTAARTEPALLEAIRTGGDLLQRRLEMSVERISAAHDQTLKDPLATALLLSIPAIRGIGLDLAVGGDRQKHRRQFHAWAMVVEHALRLNRAS